MNYSFIDASNDFAELSNNIGRFKEILCGEKDIEITSQDYRLVTLDSIQQYLLSLTAYLRSFVKLQEIISKEEFLKVLNLGISEEQLDGKGFGIIYIFPIRSLVVMVHFVIDSYLKEICSEDGFYKKVEKSFLSIDKNDLVEKFKNDLHCLGFFRNTFHGFGYHEIHKSIWEDSTEPVIAKIDRTFECDGLKIEFKHKQTAIYNWKVLYLLIRECVEALKFLMLNKK